MDDIIEMIMEIFFGPFADRLENKIKKVPGRFKKIILYILFFVIVLGIIAALSCLFQFIKTSRI